MNWTTTRHPVLAVLAVALWAASASAARPDEFPTGKYVQKTDNGQTWSLAFDGKGNYSVSKDGKEGVVGTYKVDKDQVTFTDESGQMADKDKRPGTYRWKLTGKRLSFAKVKDDFDGRADVITGGVWAKE